MNFNVDEHPGAVVITLAGNVMGGPDGADLRDKLQELKEAGKKNIVVDLAQAKFMNSSGLGMLISALTSMRNAGGDVRLANVADRIHSLLVITKLNNVFKSYDSTEDAVNSYDEDPVG